MNRPPQLRGPSNTNKTQILSRVKAGASGNYAGKTDENPDCHALTGMYGHPQLYPWYHLHLAELICTSNLPCFVKDVED